jgi:Gpi18-like mannosyltransferase
MVLGAGAFCPSCCSVFPRSLYRVVEYSIVLATTCLGKLGNCLITQKIKAWYGKIPYSLKVAILIALIAKLAVFSIGYVAAYKSGGSTAPLQLIMGQFSKWDSPHYMFIAQNGYVNEGDPTNFIVFFPLYPLLVRLITFDFAYIELSGLIISNVSSIIAVIYLFKLARLDYSDSVAKKAVLYLSVFPTAYFLSAVYTESLFLALVIASLYYARNAKWALAGFLGFLASLTRIAGLLLLPVLVVEYLHQKEWKIKAANLKLLWTSLPAFGFLLYLIINYQVTGNFFTFMEIERVHWYQTLNPVGGLAGSLGWLSNTDFLKSLTLGYAQIVFAVFGLLMVLAAYKARLRPSYGAYLLLTWMLSVSTGFWISVPRYVLTMFPMFIILALWSQKRVVTIAIVAISSAALGYFTGLFATGAWAF